MWYSKQRPPKQHSLIYFQASLSFMCSNQNNVLYFSSAPLVPRNNFIFPDFINQLILCEEYISLNSSKINFLQNLPNCSYLSGPNIMICNLFSNKHISCTSPTTQTKPDTYVHQKEELPVLSLVTHLVDPRC